MTKLLTKSAYMKGLESPRLLWTYVHDRERLPDHDEATKDRFRQGHAVQEQAQRLFDGIELSDAGFMANIQRSKRLLDAGNTVFEAGIKQGRLYARSDIIRPTENGIVLIEVKSSTSVKDYHLDDLAFQKHVLEQQGRDVHTVEVIHINTDYRRQGELEPEELLIQQDVTSKVEDAQKGIEDRIHEMLTVINHEDPPEFNPANIPDSTHGNPLIDAFKNNLPDDSVYHLYYERSKQHDLYDDGVKHLQDIPEHVDLTRKQRIQKRVAASKEPHVDEDKISDFLDGLEHPLIYLDFEAMNHAIPLYDDTTPYEQIPFQYSMHVEDKEGNVDHNEYVDQATGDPRQRFLDALKSDLPPRGSIIVWNEWFEKHVLRGLETHTGEPIPSFDRFTDLQDVFTEFWYYDPKQRGSTSLKTIYPLLSEDKHVSYEELPINKGDTAALRYKRQRDNPDDRLVKVLKQYCGLDTYSMKVIKDQLRTHCLLA